MEMRFNGLIRNTLFPCVHYLISFACVTGLICSCDSFLLSVSKPHLTPKFQEAPRHVLHGYKGVRKEEINKSLAGLSRWHQVTWEQLAKDVKDPEARR